MLWKILAFYRGVEHAASLCSSCLFFPLFYRRPVLLSLLSISVVSLAPLSFLAVLLTDVSFIHRYYLSTLAQCYSLAIPVGTHNCQSTPALQPIIWHSVFVLVPLLVASQRTAGSQNTIFPIHLLLPPPPYQALHLLAMTILVLWDLHTPLENFQDQWYFTMYHYHQTTTAHCQFNSMVQIWIAIASWL